MSKSLLRAAFLGALLAFYAFIHAADTAEDARFKTVDGLAVYLGVVPAAIVRGHPSGHTEQAMHGGVRAPVLENAAFRERSRSLRRPPHVSADRRRR